MVTEEDSEDDSFLGVIHVDTATVSQEWTIPVTLNREFKIDTGADVTVIPETVYEKERDGPMSRVEIRLSGASQHPLHVCGKCQGRNITKTKQDIYVVQKPLLGRPSIEALRVVTMVEPAFPNQEWRNNSVIFLKAWENCRRSNSRMMLDRLHSRPHGG